VGPGTTTHYYLPDGLGSTMKLVDSSGTVVNTYEYDVYGAFRSGSVPQPNQYRFAGEETQAGIQYLRARYYDTATGRFLSTDPYSGSQRLPSSQNLYPYIRNNPATLIDPLGHQPGCTDDKYDEDAGSLQGLQESARWYSPHKSLRPSTVKI
jgi:RHS repeat-associated protein